MKKKIDYFQIIGDIDCLYKDKCISRGMKCNDCKHNNKKKDYYQKEYPFYTSIYTSPHYVEPKPTVLRLRNETN